VSPDNEIPIIGAKKKRELQLEIPALFVLQLFFINHSGEGTKMEFSLPPGVYPNARWLETLVKDATRNALKTLKLSTKDLSWRKPTPAEFLRMTAGPASEGYKVESKWLEPYSNPMEIDLPEVEEADEKV